MKKMRKLIPAFAMLLVSAIMMSTASFAWFTMNDEVTATGMNIQAQATGSLVIGDAPLFYNNDQPSVGLNGDTTTLLKPITWDDGWKVANGDKVDMHTGKVDGDLVSAGTIDLENNPYFVDRDIYIGSAGDTLYNQAITINMSAIATSAKNIYNAYAVAIYVIDSSDANAWADGAMATAAEKPDAIVYVDSMAGRNVYTLRGENDEEAAGDVEYYKGYTIPSIVGATTEGVGLKIVLRFFVDGDLNAVDNNGRPITKEVPALGYEAAGDTFVSGTAYFEREGEGTEDDPYVYTAADLTGLADGDRIADRDWYVVDADYTVEAEYNYVNTDNVPMTGSSLKVAFTAEKEPQYVAPAEPEGGEG